jgi:hypothetical protein
VRQHERVGHILVYDAAAQRIVALAPFGGRSDLFLVIATR